ncbi:MAG: MBL fold metallo-hydrolase [Alphaproteobacteria bacterium]
MKHLIAIGAGLAALLSAPAFGQQQIDFTKVEIKTTDLGHGLYEMEGAGGNLAVLTGADGVLMVDTEFAPLAEKIKAAIAKASDKPLKFVIDTHWHGDHIGGNEPMAQAGAVLISQENVRLRMAKGQWNARANAMTPPAAPGALPSFTYTDALTLHLDGETVQVIHAPAAHTDGDSLIYFAGANVLHTGDVYRNTGYPFIDLASGGTLAGTITAYETILAMIDGKTKIIPGHGPLAKKKDIQASHDMLVLVRDRVQKLIDQGKNEDEIVAAAPTKDIDKKWTGKGGFVTGEVMVRQTYESIKGILPPTAPASKPSN